MDVNIPEHELQDLREQLQMSDTDSERTPHRESLPEPSTPTPEPSKKPRPVISKVERSSNARLPFASNRHKYVHVQTERVATFVYEDLKVTGKCRVCTKDLTTSHQQRSRHAWDHFVLYLCSCGEFFRSFEESNSHRRYDHQDKVDFQKVCPMLYPEVKELHPTFDLPPDYPGEGMHTQTFYHLPRLVQPY